MHDMMQQAQNDAQEAIEAEMAEAATNAVLVFTEIIVEADALIDGLSGGFSPFLEFPDFGF